MALPTQLLFFLPLLLQHPTRADTCSDCFTQSRAAYYPNSDKTGSETGASEYGSFGATPNDGDALASSSLYRNGVGCGACYQYCSNDGVMIIITDAGVSGNTKFILSQHAFARMGQNADLGASLLSLGAVGIEYRRSSNSTKNMNIFVKFDGISGCPAATQARTSPSRLIRAATIHPTLPSKSGISKETRM
ncbi:unnamed protein product [Musa acuminata var. zebrina]